MSTLNVANITDGTTTVGTEYVVNGSAKAWVNMNGIGTIAIRVSLNVSSLTDNGVGQYKVNFTNAMASNNYAAFVSDVSRGDATVGVPLTTSQEMYHYAPDGASLTDNGLMTQSIFGDLA